MSEVNRAFLFCFFLLTSLLSSVFIRSRNSRGMARVAERGGRGRGSFSFWPCLARPPAAEWSVVSFLFYVQRRNYARKMKWRPRSLSRVPRSDGEAKVLDRASPPRCRSTE